MIVLRLPCTVALIVVSLIVVSLAKKPPKACKVCKCKVEVEGTRVVDCAKKNLTQWPTDIPANVTYLFMLNNFLDEIPPDAFDHVEKLEYVSLAHNNLTILPHKLFHGNPHLRWVFLEANKLESLPDDIFEGAIDIRQLSVINNTNLDCASLSRIKRRYEIEIFDDPGHCNKYKGYERAEL